MSVRPNARTARSSARQVMSSLVPLYHSSAHFLPLRAAALPSLVDPIIAPLDGTASHQPLLSQLGPLVDRAALVNAARHKAKYSPLAELPAFGEVYARTAAITAAPLSAGWVDAHRTGSENALVARVRRAVDGVCGTVGGGFAGVATVAELGTGAMEEARLRVEERSAEEAEMKRQESLDARLEEEYRAEEEARV